MRFRKSAPPPPRLSDLTVQAVQRAVESTCGAGYATVRIDRSDELLWSDDEVAVVLRPRDDNVDAAVMKLLVEEGDDIVDLHVGAYGSFEMETADDGYRAVGGSYAEEVYLMAQAVCRGYVDEVWRVDDGVFKFGRINLHLSNGETVSAGAGYRILARDVPEVAKQYAPYAPIASEGRREV